MNIAAPQEYCDRCNGLKSIFVPLADAKGLVATVCPKCEGKGSLTRSLTEYEQYLIDKIRQITTWKPMWTAPKDGTKVLACDIAFKKILYIWWKKDVEFTEGGYWCIVGTFQAIYGLSHWHEVPPVEVE